MCGNVACWTIKQVIHHLLPVSLILTAIHPCSSLTISSFRVLKEFLVFFCLLVQFLTNPFTHRSNLLFFFAHLLIFPIDSSIPLRNSFIHLLAFRIFFVHLLTYKHLLTHPPTNIFSRIHLQTSSHASTYKHLLTHPPTNIFSRIHLDSMLP